MINSLCYFIVLKVVNLSQFTFALVVYVLKQFLICFLMLSFLKQNEVVFIEKQSLLNRILFILRFNLLKCSCILNSKSIRLY